MTYCAHRHSSIGTFEVVALFTRMNDNSNTLDSLFLFVSDCLEIVAEPEGELGGAELPLETVELPLEKFFFICTIKFSSLNTFKANTRS